MATYKVIQDIEAEDKLLGPLTLWQFIYAVIVVVSGVVGFKPLTVQWYLVLPLLPHMIFFGMLAAPFGHDQPSEVWMLAKIRFFLKPRRRIWDQSGIKDLVTISVPKKIERQLTKGFSQTEVRSRLHALANTIDSRGWAVKSSNVNLFSQPAYAGAGDESDRLLAPSGLPQDVPILDVLATDDMLDEQNNPTAQSLSQMMQASSQSHKQQAIDNMRHPAPSTGGQQPLAADYWFLNGPVNPAQNIVPGMSGFDAPTLVVPGQSNNNPMASTAAEPTANEERLIEKVQTQKAQPNPAYGNMRTVQPAGQSGSKGPQPGTSSDDNSGTTNSESGQSDGVTSTPNPAIIQLASNDDLNVETIARQAGKANNRQLPEDEVVISLR